MASYYAWSDLYYGGETEQRERADGRSYKVVMSRNIKRRGEKVTQKELGLNDEQWDAAVEGGSIRPYPVPEEASEWVSPTQAIINRLYRDGEVDPNQLLEMSLQNPPALSTSDVDTDKAPAGA
jgi:hypothetical protein